MMKQMNQKEYSIAYALVQMWDLLVWQGKHPQAPVAVAAKPHYFSELNIKQTVRNLLKLHPEFFASEQMLDTVRSGEILALDLNFFCQVGITVFRALTQSHRFKSCHKSSSTSRSNVPRRTQILSWNC